MFLNTWRICKYMKCKMKIFVIDDQLMWRSIREELVFFLCKCEGVNSCTTVTIICSNDGGQKFWQCFFFDGGTGPSEILM